MRTNLKTAQNNLEKLGNIYFREFRADHFDVLNAVQRFIRLHKNRWPNGRLATDEERYSKFYFELAISGKERVRILELWSNDNLVASNFNFSDGKRLYYFSPAFNSEYDRYSPGNLLIKKHIEICKEEGLEIFDFMNDLESYKLKWTNLIESRWSIELYSSICMSSKFLELRRKFGLLTILGLLSNRDSRSRFINNPFGIIRRYFRS